MQEVYDDETTGEIIEADTLEELFPKIKESLDKPKVKYVKLFRIPGKKFKQEERVSRQKQQAEYFEKLFKEKK